MMVKDLDTIKNAQKVIDDCKKEAKRLIKLKLDKTSRDIIQIRDVDFSNVIYPDTGDVSVVYFCLSTNGTGVLAVEKIPYRWFFMTNKQIRQEIWNVF